MMLSDNRYGPRYDYIVANLSGPALPSVVVGNFDSMAAAASAIAEAQAGDHPRINPAYVITGYEGRRGDNGLSTAPW